MKQRAYVPAGSDRRQQQRQVLGNLTLAYKVLGEDTGGGLFILENISHGRGGPPRHIHHAQEEWFYAVAGEFIVEVGAEQFRLHPGDSLLAPRQEPHAWAHTGDDIGRLLVGFHPAGAMEAFFDEFAKMNGTSTPEAMQSLFRAHGMEIVGPPL